MSGFVSVHDIPSEANSGACNPQRWHKPLRMHQCCQTAAHSQHTDKKGHLGNFTHCYDFIRNGIGLLVGEVEFNGGYRKGNGVETQQCLTVQCGILLLHKCLKR